MDTISKAARSALMGRIRSKDTQPEKAVRSIVHRQGFRFRLHVSDLPGRPDIVLPRHRKVILVHGCFWHGHDCALGSKPKSNRSYWQPKLKRNRDRDKRNARELRQLGWEILELWECDVRAAKDIERKIATFMRG